MYIISIGSKYKFIPLELEKLKAKVDYINENELSQIDKSLVVLNLDNPSKEIIDKLKKDNINFITLEEFLEKYLKKVYISDNFNCTLKPYSKFQYLIKRVIDFSIAIPLGIITIPIMLYSAYRIKKESPDGPIIFKQERVGLNNKTFVCYKFRSMIPDAEKGIPKFASKDDPRIFKWGAFMRKTRIDELPQLFNVIKGDMHMIGPRPEREYWIKQFKKEIPHYNKRHLIKPGITGWAQVNYPYGDNVEDAKQKLMYDLYYIKNWSLWLEIKTIFKTIWVMCGGKGV